MRPESLDLHTSPTRRSSDLWSLPLRLIRLYLTLIVVLSGAIVAIHLIGGLYPNPIAVLFTNPDGSPCQMPGLFGARPRVATLQDAFRLLDKHPLTHGMDNGTNKAIAF